MEYYLTAQTEHAERDTEQLSEISARGIHRLAELDPELHGLLEQEQKRQAQTMMLVAASSSADPSVLACKGMSINNITTEGYPGRRFHAGCVQVDQIERLAISRAKQVFGAKYANLQPHSGTSANLIVISSMLQPGDCLLGMELNSGGHLTHGSNASITGRYYRSIGYSVDERGFIDYKQVAQLAHQHRPKLIICGASSYPRAIDFAQFRAIADDVGAWLLADISHIAGLVATGRHQSPIDHAHFTTTSTYKQLYGPRGGMILMGKDYLQSTGRDSSSLAKTIQKAVFPFFQGTPDLSAIAAKARALDQINRPEFSLITERIIKGAHTLARGLNLLGYQVVTGGTDNHMVLVDLSPAGMSGLVAERALESCRIIINKNKIPGDPLPASVTSGIRLGTNTVALQGMEGAQLEICAQLLHKVLSSLTIYSEKNYQLDSSVQEQVIHQVSDLCTRFPIPHYPNLAPHLSTGVG